VDIRLGVTVAAAEKTADGVQLQLSSGETVQAETVVVGVGVVTNVELAAAAGLDLRDGGVLVDGFGTTSDRRIYAAGEVATHFNARDGGHDRQDTWNHAAAHGEHVGRSMIAAGEPYAETPSYWSDQYDINLQIVGATLGEIDVVRGDPDDGRFLVFHLKDGRIAGVSAVNAVRDLRAARRLIGRRAKPDELADANADLTAIALD